MSRKHRHALFKTLYTQNFGMSDDAKSGQNMRQKLLLKGFRQLSLYFDWYALDDLMCVSHLNYLCINFARL